MQTNLRVFRSHWSKNHRDFSWWRSECKFLFFPRRLPFPLVETIFFQLISSLKLSLPSKEEEEEEERKKERKEQDEETTRP